MVRSSLLIRSRLAICACCMTVFVCSPVAGAATFDDIAKILRDNEQFLRSMAVTIHCKVLQTSISDPSQTVRLTIDEKVLIDAEGRCRVESTGESFVNGPELKVHPENGVGVFNGHTMKSMTGGGKHFNRGLITSSHSDLPLRLDPRLVTTHYFNRPVTALLAERPGAVLLRETTWEGRPAIELASAIYDNADDDRRYLITVVPDLNYAIVRRAAAVRYDGCDRWDDYTRFIASDYHEATPGFWVPRTAVHESFDPTREQSLNGTAPPLSWRWDIRMSEWEINPVLSDSLFDLEFAPGVFVNDQVAGRSFKMAGVSNELIESQVSEAADWKSKKRSSPMNRLLVFNAVAFGIAALAIMLWRLRRSH